MRSPASLRNNGTMFEYYKLFCNVGLLSAKIYTSYTYIYLNTKLYFLYNLVLANLLFFFAIWQHGY